MTTLGESLLAIHEDNIPLQGVFAWCMYLTFAVDFTSSDEDL